MATTCNDICRAIAFLSPYCTRAEAEKTLNALFESYSKGNDDVIDGITPLMVACDKANVACLEYMKLMIQSRDSSWISDCIGNALDQSPEEGNSAMHYAAMAGCVPAISILATMGAASALELGSARNAHGDTPLMMAATSGQAQFCRTWQEFCRFQENVTSEDILKIWKLKNQSQDSCLSLACGHGHNEVVEFLLSPDCGVSADLDVIIQCKTFHERMEAALRRNPSLTQVHRDQAERVRFCIDMLQVDIARVSELAAEELLRSEPSPTSQGKGGKSLRKSRIKKNKATNKQQRKSQTTLSDHSSNYNLLPEREQRNMVHFMTLSDGKKAVRVEGGLESTDQTPLMLFSHPHRSADELFRERFQNGRICSEVDSVLRALCLDMSMLLYTPHGMAIDLSPSQLDAIQDILEKQLHAVHDARAIQERLHKTPICSDNHPGNCDNQSS